MRIMMSTSTSSSQSIISTSKKNTNIVGGDYAGLLATFSSKTGELISVPEHLVPASMLEWGDIPSSLEILTSEDWLSSSNDDCNDAKEMERTTITVLPEVGCGIDNLEVIKKIEKFGHDVESRLISLQHPQHPEREVVVLDCKRGQSFDMETIFQVDSEVNTDEKVENIIKAKCTRRVRVSLSVDTKSKDPTISKQIKLQIERQYSPQSTQGKAWSGPSYNSGGLDARTVMNTIGKNIVYGDVFAVKTIKGGGDVWDDLTNGTVEKNSDVTKDTLEGMWTQKMVSPNTNDIMEVQRTGVFFGGDSESGDPSVVALRLPQNILIRHGTGLIQPSDGMWGIEVSHLVPINRDGKTYLQRRVVSRSIPTDKLSAGEDETSNIDLGNVSYWIEDRCVESFAL